MILVVIILFLLLGGALTSILVEDVAARITGERSIVVWQVLAVLGVLSGLLLASYVNRIVGWLVGGLLVASAIIGVVVFRRR